MKNWKIDEFLAECEFMCRNQYTYDYDRMPEGLCNGHHVKPYFGSWHSIVIDGRICNMAVYSDKWPNGSTMYIVRGRTMTALEYVRTRLEEPVFKEDLVTPM